MLTHSFQRTFFNGFLSTVIGTTGTRVKVISMVDIQKGLVDEAKTATEYAEEVEVRHCKRAVYTVFPACVDLQFQQYFQQCQAFRTRNSSLTALRVFFKCQADSLTPSFLEVLIPL